MIYISCTFSFPFLILDVVACYLIVKCPISVFIHRECKTDSKIAENYATSDKNTRVHDASYEYWSSRYVIRRTNVRLDVYTRHITVSLGIYHYTQLLLPTFFFM